MTFCHGAQRNDNKVNSIAVQNSQNIARGELFSPINQALNPDSENQPPYAVQDMETANGILNHHPIAA